MSEVTPSLNDLRAEIDRIDDTLLSLLEERVAIGRLVAIAKGTNSGPFLRPGREAAILRRLILKSREQGDLQVEVVERIWREILAANLARQVDPVYAVFAPKGEDTLIDLARDRGGCSTRLERVNSPKAALSMVASGAATLAVLPAPGEVRWRWWPLLIEEFDLKPRIVARLPLFATEGGDAVGVAVQDPDPSGDDVSYFAVEGAAQGALDQANSADGRTWSLVRHSGFLEEHQGAVPLGAHAAPLSLTS